MRAANTSPTAMIEELAGPNLKLDVEHAGGNAWIGEAEAAQLDTRRAHAGNTLAERAALTLRAPLIEATSASISKMTVAAQAKPVAP